MSDASVLPAGRRNVHLGASFTRAITARRSGSTAPAKKPLHPREFYSVRCKRFHPLCLDLGLGKADNFRPPSVDEGGRGRVIVDSSNVTIERPSTQSSESHRWLGTEKPAKEWDCILIYDEANESYTLEKLESVVTLTHQPRLTINEAPAKQTSTPVEIADELERELLETVVDPARKGKAAVTKADDVDVEDYFDEIVPDDRREEEEEEEGEVVQTPPRSAPIKLARAKPASPPLPPPTRSPVKPAPAPTKAAARPKLPAKPSPAPAPIVPVAKPTPAPAPPPPPPTSASTAPAPKPRPKPVPVPRAKKQKREPEPVPSSYHHLSDADEEVLDFGKPTKRARLSPPRSQGLALPSASTAAFMPPALALPTAPPAPVEVGSESEEEWDQVATVGEEAKTVDTDDDYDIFGDAAGAGDDTMDIGMDELERELNLHMDEEDGEDEEEDFLASVVEEAPPSRGAPVSLKELANGAPYASDDDYSSSDDSDDD
ncbi:hypothetical protein H0H92_003813 [Tricholoma furcatifolium]|nr:hypothetical protein H0H92_003813 [Tricholoma furcatifolium]